MKLAGNVLGLLTSNEAQSGLLRVAADVTTAQEVRSCLFSEWN